MQSRFVAASQRLHSSTLIHPSVALLLLSGCAPHSETTYDKLPTTPVRAVGDAVLTDAPRLSIDSKELDIGVAWESPAHEHHVTLHNPTEEPIRITGFSTSCSCLSIEPRSLTVESGESAHLRLFFDLVRPQGRSTLLHNEEPYSVNVSPNAIGLSLQSTPRWQFTGRVRQAMHCEPPSLDYPAGSIVADVHADHRTVLVTVADGLTVCEPEADSTLFSAATLTAATTNDPPGYTMTLTPTHGL